MLLWKKGGESSLMTSLVVRVVMEMQLGVSLKRKKGQMMVVVRMMEDVLYCL